MKSLAHQKLDIVHSEKTVSPKRWVEFFYEDFFVALYGNPEELNEHRMIEVKNKMHIFSLAYGINRTQAPETFNKNQQKLKFYIEELKYWDDFTQSSEHEKFNNILTILLKDVVVNLRKQGKEHIFKNIFWEYVNIIWENEFICLLSEETMYEKNLVQENISDILWWDWYKNALDKNQYLLDSWLSYRRWIEVYYEKIRDNCFTKEDKEDPDTVSSIMQMFNVAYNLNKLKFNENKRDSWERYFEHLLAVVDLYLGNESKPTFEWVMIAILHDVIEDSDIDKETLEVLFWKEIASWVDTLSKPSVEKYVLTEGEEEFFIKWIDSWFLNSSWEVSDDILRREKDLQLTEEENLKLDEHKKINAKYKKQRNIEYFKKFREKWLKDNLSPAENRNTRIKIYDRIHNTITLTWFWIWKIDKIFQKIDETIEYFLPITSKHYPDLHEKLVKELDVVLSWLMEEVSKHDRSKHERNRRKKLRKKIRWFKKRIQKFKTVNEQVDIIQSM